jgi:hypothetical protein
VRPAMPKCSAAARRDGSSTLPASRRGHGTQHTRSMGMFGAPDGG